MSKHRIGFIETTVTEYDHYDPPKVSLAAYVIIWNDSEDIAGSKRWDNLAPAQYRRFQSLQNRLANRETTNI